MAESILGEAQAKLIAALVEAKASQHMIDKALDGEYDDYRNKLTATPCIDLVRDAKREGLRSIERRAKNGEFDATMADSDAWAKSTDGQAAFKELLRG